MNSLCYCLLSADLDSEKLKCKTCGRHCHIACLKSGRPSPLKGDIFFMLECESCSSSGQEIVKRLHLPWLPVIVLALYNLQLSGVGKLGYFRWKENICTFIENHWQAFFGSKKHTSSVGGTVAGVLSSWSNIYFKSGTEELNQAGWWKLINASPPSIDLLTVTRAHKVGLLAERTGDVSSIAEKSRKKIEKSGITVATQLKNKKNLPKLKDGVFVIEPKSHEINLSAGVSTYIQQEGIYDDNITCIVQDSGSLTVNAADISFDLGTSVDSILPLVENDAFWPLPVVNSYEDLVDIKESPASWITEQDLLFDDSIPDFMTNEDLDTSISCSLENVEPTLPSSILCDKGGTDTLAVLRDILSGEPTWSYDRSTAGTNESQTNKPLWNKASTTNQNLYQQTISAADKMSAVTSEPSGGDSVSDATSQKDDFTDTDSQSDAETGKVKTERNVRPKKKQKTKKKMGEVEKEENPQQKLQMMTLYEEKQLLKLLDSYEDSIEAATDVYRLRCKLRLRQLKRERGLPVFDLDSYTRDLMQKNGLNLQNTEFSRQQVSKDLTSPVKDDQDLRILDRYQSSQTSSYVDITSHESMTFKNRLMGNPEGQLSLIYSPYTTRILKPFIRRDFEIKPMRLKLMEEIVAFSHRNDSSWKRPPSYPLDFCYVRPKHIPAVNNLCQQFFWPGINLSDCLKYPDNSCVVLYRSKILGLKGLNRYIFLTFSILMERKARKSILNLVVGFAFMVPDVAYNESYISFIFTRPDWRRAGIASFMLYHLIQTSPGKDITLHVSSSNPALLLYQKFGFKEEEFVIDFYDKYFPMDSKECRHAFFMRLRR